MEPHPQGTAKDTKRHEGAFGANAVRLLRGPSCASWWESRRAPRRRAVQRFANNVPQRFPAPPNTTIKPHQQGPTKDTKHTHGDYRANAVSLLVCHSACPYWESPPPPTR